MREVGSVARRYVAGYVAYPPEGGRSPEAFDVYVRSHDIADHSDFSSRTSGGLDQAVVAGPAAPLKTVVLFDSFGASLMPRTELDRGWLPGSLCSQKSPWERGRRWDPTGRPGILTTRTASRGKGIGRYPSERRTSMAELPAEGS